VAGGKFDFTIKWWHFRRWQAVVDALCGQVRFVQVGDARHYHPALKGVLDLRGETSLRDLIHLVYHAQGVVCPVTLLMHLAAAVESKPGASSTRPCVVVAGGREPATWEAYPGHRFLHTIGQLPCCATGGCWRARSVPLGDGDSKDLPQHLCVDVVNNLPHCMHLITPEQVTAAVQSYLIPERRDGEACEPEGAGQGQSGGGSATVAPAISNRDQVGLGLALC
jgi:ADP-heptose:LPS heptosyltransferase